MGNHDVSQGVRKNLAIDLDVIQTELMGIMDKYYKCLEQYDGSMTKSLENGAFYDENKLKDIHKGAKEKSVSQV